MTVWRQRYLPPWCSGFRPLRDRLLRPREPPAVDTHCLLPFLELDDSQRTVRNRESDDGTHPIPIEMKQPVTNLQGAKSIDIEMLHGINRFEIPTERSAMGKP